MNRRAFFQALLITPTITPFLLASKKTNSSSELFLISDDPQRFLPGIIDELQKDRIADARTFTFLNVHPQEKEIRRLLSNNGCEYSPDRARAELHIEFSSLQDRARPSFTLVRDGRIWDLRTNKLFSVWKELFNSGSFSSSLTSAVFRKASPLLTAGKSLVVYRGGQKLEKLRIDHNVVRTYPTKQGNITVVIQDRKAWVSKSGCTHKVCLYTPPVSLTGERIVCAPGHFLIEIQGSRGIDTVIG